MFSQLKVLQKVRKLDKNKKIMSNNTSVEEHTGSEKEQSEHDASNIEGSASDNDHSDNEMVAKQPKAATVAKIANQDTPATNAKSVAAGGKRKTLGEMVIAALMKMNERKGSSLAAIKKILATEYELDIEKVSKRLRAYLVAAVASGELEQTKGKGASGSFRVAADKKKAILKPKAKPKKKPAPTKKAAPVKAKASAAKAAAETASDDDDSEFSDDEDIVEVPKAKGKAAAKPAAKPAAKLMAKPAAKEATKPKEAVPKAKPAGKKTAPPAAKAKTIAADESDGDEDAAKAPPEAPKAKPAEKKTAPAKAKKAPANDIDDEPPVPAKKGKCSAVVIQCLIGLKFDHFLMDFLLVFFVSHCRGCQETRSSYPGDGGSIKDGQSCQSPTEDE